MRRVIFHKLNGREQGPNYNISAGRKINIFTNFRGKSTLCLGTRLAESQDTKSLMSARYLLFPSTSDGTCFSHDKKETFTCFTVKLAS